LNLEFTKLQELGISLHYTWLSGSFSEK